MAEKMKDATNIEEIMSACTPTTATKEKSAKKDATTETETKKTRKKRTSATTKQINALKKAIANTNNTEIAQLLEKEIAFIKKQKFSSAFYEAVGRAFLRATDTTETVSRADIKELLKGAHKRTFSKVK